MTIHQDNARLAATTAERAITAERRAAVTTALAHLTTDPAPRRALVIDRRLALDTAVHVMLRSLERQARIAGIRLDYPTLTRAVGR